MAAAMAENSGHPVHPFFMPRDGFDQNEGRRKRQRTASPKSKPASSTNLNKNAWADQLIVAAFGPPVALDCQEEPAIDNEQQIGQAQTKGARGHARGSTQADSNINGAPDNVNSDPLAQRNEAVCGKCPEDRLAATPPKRMLRVRPDGKLGSPKTRTAAADAKPKRTRRSVKVEAGKKTLVVNVKFGAASGDRVDIGRKIDGILSGAARYPSPSKQQSAKPKEPPKPTHPFFIGGAARLSCQENVVSHNNQNDVDAAAPAPQQQRQIDSTRQARVISKPVGVADSPATGMAFGSNTFGTDHARASRFPGAMEPMWPPLEMLHVGRPSGLPKVIMSQLDSKSPTNSLRKLKGVQIGVSRDEDVLKPYINLVEAYQGDRRISQMIASRDWRQFRRPLRRLLTGRDLQQVLRQRLVSEPDLGLSVDQEVDELSVPRSLPQPAHSAIQHAYDRIADSLTAFDHFECETQDWVHKYAPKSAEDVLQQSHEVILLRDWLRSLTIRSVENQASDKQRAREPFVVSKRRVTRKKRKRAEGLDDFVVSSEDDTSQMGEITDPEDTESSKSLLKRSIIRTGDNTSGCERRTNAVVISGPHGCGKTAAVHAVAQELGFKIFEIHSGERRSGKDILDEVGDMTRNHLVTRDPETDRDAASQEKVEEQELFENKTMNDVESGRQGTMTSFFKSKPPVTKKQKAKTTSSRKEKPQPNDEPKTQKQRSQKQSLILLEEVDVLFEEDKMFWTTVLDMILQSKRPIIMTCTDESLLPLDEMALYAIFRFGPPAEQLAVDYLLLIACNEGHLLSRDAVAALYRAKGFDLRASIAELNFFCQMAVGDTKGGLEWMLIPSSKDRLKEQTKEQIRVVSDGTYQYGMGWLSGESSMSWSGLSIGLEAELLSNVWNGWGIDIGAVVDNLSTQLPISTDAVSRRENLEALQRCEVAFEAFSATDTFPACVSRKPNQRRLDPTGPELTERSRTNYVEGATLLQTDLMVDQTDVANSLLLTLRACSRRILTQNNQGLGPSHFGESSILRIIPEIVQKGHSETPFRSRISPAFEPISRSQKPVLGIPRGPQISVFDGPMSVIAEDLAPYVRSIVSYDLRLEEQRRQLSSLFSQPGKNGKKTRTTRASRAALEGGSKAHTRRERWFPNSTNFDLVLQSGGEGWNDSLLQITTGDAQGDGASQQASPRSSPGSAMESDI